MLYGRRCNLSIEKYLFISLQVTQLNACNGLEILLLLAVVCNLILLLKVSLMFTETTVQMNFHTRLTPKHRFSAF